MMFVDKSWLIISLVMSFLVDASSLEGHVTDLSFRFFFDVAPPSYGDRMKRRVLLEISRSGKGILETLGHAAFEVVFKKQVASNDVADGLVGEDITTQAERRKIVRRLMEGEERVMHARLHRTEEFGASMELGRYRVIDLDELLRHGDDGKHLHKAFRLIDTCTITEQLFANDGEDSLANPGTKLRALECLS